MNGLVALTSLWASSDKLLLGAGQPVFPKLPMLKVVEIQGWNGPIWIIVQNLRLLETLQLIGCKGEDMGVLDLQNLERLNNVFLKNGNVKGLSGLSNLSTLESLYVYNCETLERLPELEGLSKLSKPTSLGIRGCGNLRHWPSPSKLCLDELRVDEFSLMRIAPDLETLAGLRFLTIYSLRRVDVLMMACLSRLEVLHISCSEVSKGLDVGNFPHVKDFRLRHCSTFRRWSCGITLSGLTELRNRDCGMLVEMPALRMFPQLESLSIKNCRALNRLTCSRPLAAMKSIKLIGCDRGIETPDLKWFSNLKEFCMREHHSMS